MSVHEEVSRLQQAGYSVMGLDLGWDAATNKKRCRFKCNWQLARPETCLQALFDADDRGSCTLLSTASTVSLVLQDSNAFVAACLGQILDASASH